MIQNSQDDMIMRQFHLLSSQQKTEVLDFLEFLIHKNQKQTAIKQAPDEQDNFLADISPWAWDHWPIDSTFSRKELYESDGR